MQKSDVVASLRSYPIPWICGLVGLLCVPYLYFTGDKVLQLETERDALRREVSILSTNVREGVDLEEHVKQIKGASDQLERRLLDRDQNAINVGFFFTFAQSHPVEISDVFQRATIAEKPNPTAAEIWTLKHFAVVPFDMKLIGVMNDLMDFIYALEQSDRIIRVRSFDLFQAPASKELGNMEMNLSLLLLAKSKS
jgi:high-affinity nickel permease